MNYDEYRKWEENYGGELMQLSREQVVERMRLDMMILEGANYHSECAAMGEFADLIEKLPADTAFGWFAWSINDLGSIRQCVII